MLKKKNKVRNKFEARLDRQLELSKVGYSYETERLPYTIYGSYIPDFIIHGVSGKIYIEAKGHFRPESRRKMIAVKKCNPDLDIRIIFYSFSKRNSKWALKHGFKYSVGVIPEDWLA